jgi:CBS-domain-containing membrane protein
MSEESVLVDLVKMPILAITVIIISSIGIFMGIPLMIPPFVATLFMIYLREGSEFAHLKNVLGGYIIGFSCGFMEPFISFYVLSHINFMPESLLKGITIGVAILVAGWTMAILRLEHPPAIAVTLMFLGTEKEGNLLFGLFPQNVLISFLAGLAIVSFISYLNYRNKE